MHDHIVLTKEDLESFSKPTLMEIMMRVAGRGTPKVIAGLPATEADLPPIEQLTSKARASTRTNGNDHQKALRRINADNVLPLVRSNPGITSSQIANKLGKDIEPSTARKRINVVLRDLKKYGKVQGKPLESKDQRTGSKDYRKWFALPSKQGVV